MLYPYICVLYLLCNWFSFPPRVVTPQNVQAGPALHGSDKEDFWVWIALCFVHFWWLISEHYAVKIWLGLVIVFCSGWLYPFPVLKYISHRVWKAFAWWISNEIMFMRYLYMQYDLIMLVKGSLSPIHNRVESAWWRHTKHIIGSCKVELICSG